MFRLKDKSRLVKTLTMPTINCLKRFKIRVLIKELCRFCQLRDLIDIEFDILKKENKGDIESREIHSQKSLPKIYDTQKAVIS